MTFRGNTKVLTKLLWVCCFYSFTAFLYVIAFQFTNPGSAFWGLAWWLPLRLDYFGEAGFVSSFLFAVVAILVNQKLWRD